MGATKTVAGRVSVHPRGFGFLESPEIGSAFIPPPELNAFLAGDQVEASATQDVDGRWAASGLKLVARPRGIVFGQVVLKRGIPAVRVDREVGNSEWPLDSTGQPVWNGDWVLGRPTGGKLVLVRKLDASADVSWEKIVARHLLRTEFPVDVPREIAAARATAHALGARRDLREVPTVTVDAPWTEDIDDAISVLPAGPDGGVRLLVSIADVAEFVGEGSALDREAAERGTSVYLAGRMIPMLPDELSTGWLSLRPGEDRWCLTAELRLDPEGRATATDVYESVVRSRARLSYTEVASWLDRQEIAPAMEPVREMLPWLRAAGARLGVARARRGGMRVASDEVKIVFDPHTGLATGIESVRPTSAHTLVERCMVAANEAIAGWLFDRGVPAPFRVHDRPDPQDVAELAEFARNFGFAAGFGRELTPLALLAFEHMIAGAPCEPALRSVLRRSLGPARYTVEPGPHFGLASPSYLHFTSPIRRYADLRVHRTIKEYLRGKRDFADRGTAVERQAGTLNQRARAASRAEGDRHRMLVAQVIKPRVGEEFAGRVTRVRPFGLIVQIDECLVEGTIPVESLPGGPWRPDARETAMTGPARSFAVGHAVRVRLVASDPTTGRVEFGLVEGATAP